jgi:hypothetical protein
MKSENKWMGLRAGIVSAVAILIFMTGAGASTAHAKVFHTWVEGLPSGLLVQFVGQWSCFLDNRNPFLTETQVTRWEVAPNAFGQMVLQQVTRTVYVGQADKILQSGTNCGTEAGITLNQTDFDAQYLVFGRDGGSLGFKIAQQHHEVNPDPAVEEFLTITIEAKSTSLVVAGTSTVPTTIARSLSGFQTWKATYSDTFGFQDIINPSLDFTQTSVNFLGQLVSTSKIKMWLTPDNQVCLRVAGDTECKAKAEGGTLSNNGVIVSVADVAVEGSQVPGIGNGNTMTVRWRFRFSSLGTIKAPAPAAGDYTAIISADDRDLSDGYFTGAGFGSTPQPKNLLSWKALGVPISVF